MYMLDTNILVSAIRQKDHPVRYRLANCSDGDLCISSITYAELVYGAKHSSNYEKNIQAVQHRSRSVCITILQRTGNGILAIDMLLRRREGEKQSLHLC